MFALSHLLSIIIHFSLSASNNTACFNQLAAWPASFSQGDIDERLAARHIFISHVDALIAIAWPIISIFELPMAVAALLVGDAYVIFNYYSDAYHKACHASLVRVIYSRHYLMSISQCFLISPSRISRRQAMAYSVMYAMPLYAQSNYVNNI